MDTQSYNYLWVQWNRELWCPPGVIFKDCIHEFVKKVGIFRPTALPPSTIPIQDAVNILIDILRFLDPPPIIEDALAEVWSVAKEFTTRWEITPQMALQTGEVHVMGAPARFYWRARLSCLAASKKISLYTADEAIVTVVLNDKISTNPWSMVAALVEKLETQPPSNTPS